ESTERESAFFGNLGGKRETIFSKASRLFRDRAAEKPVVWVLEQLEQIDAFTLAFLNWFYQDLQTEPAPVAIVATVSRADLVDRAGLLRYTQAILGGTEPTVRRFFISRAAERDDGHQEMGSGAAPLRSTLEDTNPMQMPDFSESPADGSRETLSPDRDGDTGTNDLFDQCLGLLAQLGDEIPKGLWERVRQEFLGDHQANMVGFILDRAEQFGIIEQTDDVIRFGRRTFAERLRDEASEADEGLIDPDTRAQLARLMLDFQDHPDRETIERAVDYFKTAGRPSDAVEALHEAGNEAFSMLDLDSAREYYLRLQHVFEQLGDEAVERVRRELAADPARIWLRIGETHGALDEHGAAEDALQRAAGLAEGRQSAVRGRALKLIADIQTAEGRLNDAERNYESAALAFARAGREGGAAAAKSLMGETVLRQGYPARAQEIFEETLADAEPLDIPLVIAHTQFRLGRARVRQGEFEPAFADLERAASGFERLRRPAELVRTEMTFGNAAFGARKFDQACQRCTRARDNCAEVRNFDGDFPTLGLARAYTAEGDFERAADCIDDPDAPDRRARARVQRVEWRRHQGDLFLVHGAYPAAADNFKQMGSQAREIGRTDLFLDALLRNAFVAFHADSFESAAKRITRAADFVKKFGGEAQRISTQVLGLYLHAASRRFPNETEDLAQHLEVADEREFDWVYTLTSVCLADVRAANGHFPAARELLKRAYRRATAVGRYPMVAAVGHRLDRIGAILDETPAPTIPGALIGGPSPPEVHRLHPDELYRAE
ncbi:MAG: tetratricopeptide repeat protein, partial [Bradymonadaceae bacterium]